MKNLLLALLGFLPLLSHAQINRSITTQFTPLFASRSSGLGTGGISIGVQSTSKKNKKLSNYLEIGHFKGSFGLIDGPYGISNSLGLRTGIRYIGHPRNIGSVKIYREIDINFSIRGANSLIQEIWDDNYTTRLEVEIPTFDISASGGLSFGWKFMVKSGASLSIHPLFLSEGALYIKASEEIYNYYSESEFWSVGLTDVELLNTRLAIPFSAFKTKHIKAP